MSSNRQVIVAGGGSVGAGVARLLHDRGHGVVLVEQDSERSEALANEHVATVITGDATRPSVLEQADLERSDAVAAVTADPGTNLAICLLAQQFAPDAFTLARIEREEQREYAEHVDTVVLPQQSIANRAVDLLVGGDVRTFTGMDGEFEVLDLAVAEGSSVEGHTLDEVNLPDGCRVIASLTAGALATPEMTFDSDGRYLVAVESGALEDVRMLFQE